MENKKQTPAKQKLTTSSLKAGPDSRIRRRAKGRDRRHKPSRDRRKAAFSGDRRKSLVGYSSEAIEHDRRSATILDRRKISEDRRDSQERRTPIDRFKEIKRFLITGGYVGYVRSVPGTVASALVVLIYGISLWALPFVIVQLLHIVVIIVALGFGYGLAEYATRVLFRTQDPKEMVLDEIAGMSISLTPFLYEDPTEMSVLRLGVYLLITFVLFRILDIFKPGLIGRMDKRDESPYVMNDDVVAGVITALVVNLILYL